MTLIECRGLTRVYKKGDAVIRPLDELDLNVARGDFLALMGPSGSGKTTLLNLIAGIDRPSAGLLRIDGLDVTQLSRRRLAAWRSQHVGYIFQLYNLVPVLTAYENVELPLLLHRISRRERHERVCEALTRVGIFDRQDYYPRQMSGGQEQRVAIARAIVTHPTILVADEPTGDLDKPSAHAVMKLLQELNQENEQTVIMVTHDPHTTEYANRTLHLDKGRLAADDRHHAQMGDALSPHGDPIRSGPPSGTFDASRVRSNRGSGSVALPAGVEVEDDRGSATSEGSAKA
ncbi:MAG: ABC transporter ATP-binding protein [Planctomycetota bacterium]